MEPAIEEFIDSMRSMLATLRSADPQGTATFGANSHLYRLSPVASERQIAAFERKSAVKLPADYRAFLAHLGNGGAGPFYGIFALGSDDDGPWSKGGLVGTLSKAFPFEREWNLPPSEVEQLIDGSDDPAAEAILERYWRPTDGAIPICTEGCALRYWLVLTGPERGHVWRDCTADFRGWSPAAAGDARRLSFADWYTDWLKAALAEARVGNRRSNESR